MFEFWKANGRAPERRESGRAPRGKAGVTFAARAFSDLNEIPARIAHGRAATPLGRFAAPGRARLRRFSHRGGALRRGALCCHSAAG